MHKAVFLDRDGVINVDHGYVHRIEDFEFVPGALEACASLSAAGYKLIVVTNQSGIARGYYDEAQFETLSQWMCAQFEQAGASIEAVYFCPHHPSKGNAPYVGDCDCRKPKPGMLLKGAREHNVDLTLSIMVGDKAGDMEAGKSAGVAHTIMVRSGKKLDDTSGATVVVDDLAKAAEWVLAQIK
ncbi:D-glycero-beta-D-manno-heptose 1,7-bisphosphate 7-phosphatase [Ferrimonas aestuarii]|uniref:D,D-heptose 1,7-bisphosphate phosphatase n=1 Tax=Ferrimonas aestuarii TaxID=2569539 RepID=A0A4V5NZ45_9GAMM|nr:D-glycero-beta-D-manno-heptose 1,7-bisphosphate 7-phosphatase [Ferrimonas aestuarii]TKB53366.1 D-glycero-beta-D-manno-heptose 1,7-bisphosphate 7-phosphatase [Ferrimonas aestuarii]